MKHIMSPFLGKATVTALFILSFLGINTSYAQLDNIFHGYISPIVAVTSSPPNFSFQGAFINQAKSYTANQATPNAFIIMAHQGACYEFDIDTIYAINNILYGDIIDVSGTLSSLPTGMAAIFEKTPNLQLLPYPAGVTNVLEACIQQKNMLIIDTLTSDPASLIYNSNRQILRVPSVGTNIGGSTVIDWLNYWYFSAPTLPLTLSPSTAVYEVGDSTAISMSGTVSNPGGATLSNGLLRTLSPLDTLNNFNAGTSYSGNIVFVPTKDSTSLYKNLTYTFRASQAWVFGSESGTANSPDRTIQAVYPVLYGMSNTDLSSTGNPYTELTKLVQTEGNKTVSLNGSGFIYYAVPKSWSDFDLSQIIDHNGFNVTPSFTAYDITVTSSGKVNNWSQDYKLYKLNTTTTTSNYAYQFNR
jgi:hypothetical protein